MYKTTSVFNPQNKDAHIKHLMDFSTVFPSFTVKLWAFCWLGFLGGSSSHTKKCPANHLATVAIRKSSNEHSRIFHWVAIELFARSGLWSIEEWWYSFFFFQTQWLKSMIHHSGTTVKGHIQAKDMGSDVTCNWKTFFKWHKVYFATALTYTRKLKKMERRRRLKGH